MTVPTLVFIPTISRPIVAPFDDGINALSNVLPSSFRVLTRSSASVSVQWNIIAYQISSSVAVAWNTDFRIKVIRPGVTPGLDKPIVAPFNWHYLVPQIAWEADHHASASVKTSWKNIKRLSSFKRVYWSDAERYEVHQAVAFRTLKQVQVPGPGRIYYAGIDQSITHPFSSVNYTPVPLQAFNVIARRNKELRTTWEVRRPVDTAHSFSWNTQIVRKDSQKAVAFVVLHAITSLKASSWKNTARKIAKRQITWSLHSTVTKQSAAHFQVRNNVTLQQASDWTLKKRIVKQANSGFRIRSPEYVRSDSTFRVLVRVSKQADIHWILGITPVAATKAASWNVFRHIDPQARITWNTVGRRARAARSLFSVNTSVSVQATMEWNTGRPVQAQIVQTAMSRLDFAY